jgi:hypothetical protein
MALPAVEKWVTRILGSQSEFEVITVVRQYLATWTPSEIAEIPERAWPGEVSAKSEICDAAVQAKIDELRCMDDGPMRVSLHELGEVLATASTRFGQLSSPFHSRRARE